MTITELSAKLKNKELSSVELTQQYLDAAKKHNETINAYITICEDEALAMAKSADEMLASGNEHALTGIPLGVKDAICTKGIRSTGAAKILDQYVPPYDATVIKKIKEKGGVIIGKQNCDAFGHGGSNENTQYGVVKNPWNTEKVPGGSSGGSAASLAAGMCAYSIGEDTGGSIRQPAALCGVTGLRPSYGRNSRYGIMPMASSLDTVGPMANSVEDIATIMEVMAGQDKMDATTVADAVPNYINEIKKPLEKMTIGLPKEYFTGETDADVSKAIDVAIEEYKKLGCTFKEVSLPHTKYAVATYYIVVPSEDSSNLARLDGIRYGSRGKGKDLFDVYANARAAGFPDECKRRIMIGTYALSAGYYDAYYKKAQKVRTLIKKDFEDALKDVDALIKPVSPTTAWDIGSLVNDPLKMYMADVFVIPGALAGVPGLAVPCGIDSSGLPIGLQIIGPRMAESRIMQLGYHYQQNTDWHTKKPSL